eukprot:scaffold2047_cov129-Cylindrotheca_fusiformis.AAC.32
MDFRPCSFPIFSQAAMSEKSEKSVIQKLLAVNSKPTEETFPELPDALLWRTINAIAFLLLIWIYFYTLEHEEEEKAIIAALYAAAGSTTTESDTTTIGDPAVQPPTSDAEF